MTDIFKLAKQTAEGRWEEYLEGKLGIDLNNGQQTSCPTCGGNDRFQFNNHKGEGNFYCRGETVNGRKVPHYGDGIALATAVIQKQTGQPYNQRHVASDILHFFNVEAPAKPEVVQKKKAQAKTKLTEKEQRTFDNIVKIRTEAAKSLKCRPYPEEEYSPEAIQNHTYYRNKKLPQDASSSSFTGTSIAPSFTGHTGNPRSIVVDYVDLPTSTICGIETIAPDGTKRTTGRKGAHVLPYFQGADVALVVEGWATGVALNHILRNNKLAHQYRVVVSGGCGSSNKIAEQLAEYRDLKARVVYEDDGQGTPEGELYFPKTNKGNDAADWLHHEPTVQLFIKQLMTSTTN